MPDRRALTPLSRYLVGVSTFGYAGVRVAALVSFNLRGEREWHTGSCISLLAGRRSIHAALAAVHPSGVGLPKGQTFHAAGPSAGGWTVMVVHDSKESWERFRDDILMPKLQEGVEGGFTTPPQEQAFEIYNQRP